MAGKANKLKALKQDIAAKQAATRKKIQSELSRLESKIEEVRILYEQYFVDVQPLPPDQQRKEIVRSIKQLLKMPFRNSADRFRLRSLVLRYQTYATYWERVNKQREEGTYSRDVFKAELREKINEEAAKAAGKNAAAERALHELYHSYEAALRKAGAAVKNLNFDAFKQSMIKKARELRQTHGAKKLQYKVMVKEGKVVVKVTAK